MEYLMRHSLCYVSYKDRKEVALDLKLVYCAATPEEAEHHLEEFAAK
jgi:putative transposase